MGQKVEASTLHVVANNQGYWIKGDVKLNGIPVALDYRKPRGDGDAEVRLQGTLDEAARSKLGFDLAGYMSGPLPVKVNGRVTAFEGGESRFAIDADLTPARIDNLLAGSASSEAKQEGKDMDLDGKVGTVVGFHGETLRGLDLTLSRRGGTIKSLAVSAKLGRDAAFSSDLRGRNGGRQVIYINAKDAGAFFRFTDMYAKMYGGEMWVAMDPATADAASAQNGLLNIQDFSVRGEAALDRVVAGAPGGRGAGVGLSRMGVGCT